jgi:hypothetical protein
MLGVRTYTKKYIAASRSKVEADLSAYKAMAAGGKVSGAFETAFFNNTVIVLDHLFVHRLRGVEGKDGNALNEVRMLSDSIMSNNGKLAIDNSIAYDASQSVLKVKVGDEIKVTEAGFLLLYKAFFAEIENKFL